MRSFWQAVRQSADVPKGEDQPFTVMSEQFTLYRGEDGAAVLMAPRCAHRLTVLSPGANRASWRAYCARLSIAA